MIGKMWMTVAAATMISASAAAEPVKAPTQAAGQKVGQAGAVILASVDLPKGVEAAPAVSADITTPAKRPRAARVTTCRCGDPALQN